MNRLILFLLLYSFHSFSSFAQEDNDWKLFRPQTKDSTIKKKPQTIQLQNGEQGKVNVHKDPRIDKLTEHVGTPQQGKATVTMKGYRIQAFFDQDKNKVNQRRAEYLSQFANGQPVYVDFLAPNFRLRIGDFRTKLDAQAYLEKIKYLFPDAVIVMDDIELPKLD